jgi:uncharacterized protein
MVKVLLIFFGTLSLAIGLIGIVVPGLPTTPFVLLTAALYCRSSEKLYSRITGSRLFGERIRRFQAEKGLTMRSKLYSISFMWTMIFISSYFFIENAVADWIVVIAGVTGTVVMGFYLPTVKKETRKL